MRILLCERCFAPVDTVSEGHYTLGHIDSVDADGTVRFVYSAVHTAPCGGAARTRSAAEPPDTGEWDRSRRGASPAAAAWINRRAERVREH
ncbi:hypothetical protein GCM10009836_08910 [Pseudonocardia ailaonensis]|uniref:C2H2-type domain-containing protein n=1 Tax=Pseudonocardia ailaonensis TaxID=367279 RepID=A0ABN2MR50_9PSEU